MFDNQIMQRIWGHLSSANTDDDNYVISSISSVLNNEEYEKCIQYFKSLSLIEANKRTSGNILLLLAESYEQVGRYKQALIHLNKLSEVGVTKYSDLVLIKQGLIYRNIGMNNKAQEIFKSLVSIYPDSEYVGLAQAEINNI